MSCLDDFKNCHEMKFLLIYFKIHFPVLMAQTGNPALNRVKERTVDCSIFVVLKLINISRCWNIIFLQQVGRHQVFMIFQQDSAHPRLGLQVLSFLDSLSNRWICRDRPIQCAARNSELIAISL